MKTKIEVHYVQSGASHWLVIYDLHVAGFRPVPTRLLRLSNESDGFSKVAWDQFNEWAVGESIEIKPCPGLIRFMDELSLELNSKLARRNVKKRVKVDVLTIDGTPFLAVQGKCDVTAVRKKFAQVTMFWSKARRDPRDLQKVYESLVKLYSVDNTSVLLKFLKPHDQELPKLGRSCDQTEQRRAQSLDETGVTWLTNGQIEILVPQQDLDDSLPDAQASTLKWLTKELVKANKAVQATKTKAVQEQDIKKKAGLASDAAKLRQTETFLLQQIERAQRKTPGAYFPAHGKYLSKLRATLKKASSTATWLLFRGSHDVSIARGGGSIFKGKAFRFEPKTVDYPEYAEFDVKV